MSKRKLSLGGEDDEQKTKTRRSKASHWTLVANETKPNLDCAGCQYNPQKQNGRGRPRLMLQDVNCLHVFCNTCQKKIKSCSICNKPIELGSAAAPAAVALVALSAASAPAAVASAPAAAAAAASVPAAASVKGAAIDSDGDTDMQHIQKLATEYQITFEHLMEKNQEIAQAIQIWLKKKKSSNDEKKLVPMEEKKTSDKQSERVLQSVAGPVCLAWSAIKTYSSKEMMGMRSSMTPMTPMTPVPSLLQ